MEKANMVKATTVASVGIFSAVIGWIYDRIGVLIYVILILAVAMIIDYITGMLASKKEAVEHPDDKSYGWNSKKGMIGILKKVGYLFVIAVAGGVDFIIIHVGELVGIDIGVKALFGLITAVWFLLNEGLSILENSGRMGTPIPAFLKKYIAVLKGKVETAGDNENSENDIIQ